MTTYNTELIISGDSSGGEAAVKRVQLLLDSLGRTYKNVEVSGTKSGDNVAAAYDRLRRSIDPLYARSKKYEAAVNTLNKALKQGIISQSQYEHQLEQTARAMQFVSGSVDNYNREIRTSRLHTANITAQLNDIAVMMMSGQSPFMLAVQQGSQLNQVFAQMGGHKATLNALLTGVRNLISPMSLLTIGVIGVGSALFQMAINAVSAKDALVETEDVLKSLKEETAGLADEVIKLRGGFESIAEAKAVDRLEDLKAKLRDLLIEAEEKLQQTDPESYIVVADAYNQRIKLLQQEIQELERQIATTRRLREEKRILLQRQEELRISQERAAREEEEQRQRNLNALITYITRAVEKAEAAEERRKNAIRQVYEEYARTRKEADELGKHLLDAYRAAQLLSRLDLASGIIKAANAAAVLANNLRITPSILGRLTGTLGTNLTKIFGGSGSEGEQGFNLGNVPKAISNLISGIVNKSSNFGENESSDTGVKIGGGGGGRRGGGGGGGGAGRDYQSELESLQEFLMTEAELELKAFNERQELLETALEKRLITQQEFNEMMEDLQKKHQDRMTEIDIYRYGSVLDQTERFFGDMADAFASGNEKMQRIAKVFGAAEALINAWRAYAQVLADPRYSFLGKLAAAAKILAAGLSAVNAIKSVGGGGGRTSAATTAATTTTLAPLQATLNLQGPFASMLQGSIGPLLDQLNKEAGDRGYQLMVRAT